MLGGCTARSLLGPHTDTHTHSTEHILAHRQSHNARSTCNQPFGVLCASHAKCDFASSCLWLYHSAMMHTYREQWSHYGLRARERGAHYFFFLLLLSQAEMKTCYFFEWKFFHRKCLRVCHSGSWFQYANDARRSQSLFGSRILVRIRHRCSSSTEAMNSFHFVLLHRRIASVTWSLNFHLAGRAIHSNTRIPFFPQFRNRTFIVRCLIGCCCWWCWLIIHACVRQFAKWMTRTDGKWCHRSENSLVVGRFGWVGLAEMTIIIQKWTWLVMCDGRSAG